MLSNRITAKSLELNPARQARKRMLNDSRDCHPAGCASPTDRPPLPGAPPAATTRLFPCSEPPALADALCFPSLAAWCSAISARGDGCFFFFSSFPFRLERPRCHAPGPCCRKTPATSIPLSSGIRPTEARWSYAIECAGFEFSVVPPRDRRYVPSRTLMRHIEPATVNLLHDWTGGKGAGLLGLGDASGSALDHSHADRYEKAGLCVSKPIGIMHPH